MIFFNTSLRPLDNFDAEMIFFMQSLGMVELTGIRRDSFLGPEGVYYVACMFQGQPESRVGNGDGMAKRLVKLCNKYRKKFAGQFSITIYKPEFDLPRLKVEEKK